MKEYQVSKGVVFALFKMLHVVVAVILPLLCLTGVHVVGQTGTAPVFVTHPTAQSASLGGGLTVSVVVDTSNLEVVTWQIQTPARSFGPASSGTQQTNNRISASLYFGPLNASDAGTFRIIATNAFGSTLSNPVTLTVVSGPPTFTEQPASVSLAAGQPLSLSVKVAGSEPFTYQWRKGGVAIPGATSASFSLLAVQAGDAGNYSCFVSNGSGSALSNTAVVTVTGQPQAPVFGGTTLATRSVPDDEAIVVNMVVRFTDPATTTWQLRTPGRTLSPYTTILYDAAAGFQGYSLYFGPMEPRDAGNYSLVVITPAGQAVSNNAVLTVTPSGTSVRVEPVPVTVKEGEPASFTVVGQGTKPITYQWRKNGVAIPGATQTTFSITSTVKSDAGRYDVILRNAVQVGGSSSRNAELTVLDNPVAPTITRHPDSVTVAEGFDGEFSVGVSGPGPFSYQWSGPNGVVVGATNPTLRLVGARLQDQGSYTVTVVNGYGFATSTGGYLDVTPRVNLRLENLSVRSVIPANVPLIVGFSVTGGSKPVVIRGIGPSLANFGVSGTLPDPKLALYDGATKVLENDNWSDLAPALRDNFMKRGFAILGDSLDAGLYTETTGGRSVHVFGSPGGNVLVELYEAKMSSIERLTNLSARTQVGVNGATLIVGFAIAEDPGHPKGAGKSILIRAVGPTLSQFAVPDVLSDPKITLYAGDTPIGSNDDWDRGLSSTFVQTGAFPLLDGSKDAAMRSSLQAGLYTFHVTGLAGTQGECLVEVYEIP